MNSFLIIGLVLVVVAVCVDAYSKYDEVVLIGRIMWVAVGCFILAFGGVDF
jgi:hypothetical protein